MAARRAGVARSDKIPQGAATPTRPGAYFIRRAQSRWPARPKRVEAAIPKPF
ncbi:hypothetical protein [Hymenobacter psoromatis]|uniref:hypothetical protein n=1 Tax=Hymenobacter psoromatis TaxID=1484116 RepID=UPI001CC11E55|nr:hypothetical protein [Hymenobacter psoromatis]